MSPEIKLFFDFEFTSLSPDAQPISLGIVSEEIKADVPIDAIREFDNGSLQLKNHKILVDSGFGMKEFVSKSFYAEFSDFDLNRCDDWVKENVVSKLKYSKEETLIGEKGGDWWLRLDTRGVVFHLKRWLAQFSEYNIQFVCDCGTFDWYWMLQLLAVWDMKRVTLCNGFMTSGYLAKIGLPKLPSNISPVPQDLNDLIALKKGISAREAFDMDRDELFFSLCDSNRTMPLPEITKTIISNHVPDKHNSLSDAKVIKAIYEKLS